MQVGDLVRRNNIWAEWQKGNEWMNSEEYSEIGIIVKWKGITQRCVLWAKSGLSWESEDEIRLIEE